MHWPLPFDCWDSLKGNFISTLVHLDLGCLLLPLLTLSYWPSILQAQTIHVKIARQFCTILVSNWNSWTPHHVYWEHPSQFELIGQQAYHGTKFSVAIMAYRITQTLAKHVSHSQKAQTYLSSLTAHYFPKYTFHLVKTPLTTISLKDPAWTFIPGVLST